MAETALSYGPKPYLMFPEPELPEDINNPLFIERFERDMRKYFNDTQKGNHHEK
jgi:hypothetical protein